MSKSKSLADNGFIIEMKDKNGDSWYHQIVVETQQEEIERLNNIIIELRKENINLIEDNMRLRKELNLHGGKLYISDIEVKKVWK